MLPYVHLKGTLWKEVSFNFGGSCRNKLNGKPTEHFPRKNRALPHRDTQCSVSL